MKTRRGDMLADLQPDDVIVFTANASVGTSRLIMGAGAALAVKRVYPNVDLSLGLMLLDMKVDQPSADIQKPFPLPPYYLLGTVYDSRQIYAFQTKRCWWEEADPSLIEGAARRLKDLAKKEKNKTFHLNYPGIGLGGLTKERVAPLLRGLPKNVIVWEKPDA